MLSPARFARVCHTFGGRVDADHLARCADTLAGPSGQVPGAATDVQNSVAESHVGQREDPFVHHAAPPQESQVAGQLIQPRVPHLVR